MQIENYIKRNATQLSDKFSRNAILFDTSSKMFRYIFFHAAIYRKKKSITCIPSLCRVKCNSLSKQPEHLLHEIKNKMIVLNINIIRYNNNMIKSVN